jgi:hypothetical protein
LSKIALALASASFIPFNLAASLSLLLSSIIPTPFKTLSDFLLKSPISFISFSCCFFKSANLSAPFILSLIKNAQEMLTKC